MGEASAAAKADRAQSDPSYNGKSNEYVEGAAGLIPHTGSLESVVQSFAMGLRSRSATAALGQSKSPRQSALHASLAKR